MVKVMLPSGNCYHQPPYTEEEIIDLERRASGVVAFTRPMGLAAQSPRTPAPAQGDADPGSGGDAASAPAEDPGPDPGPS